MSKSIDDILRRMEQERVQRMEQEALKQQKIHEQNLKSKQEWTKLNILNESVLSPNSASSAAGGGSITVLTTPTVEIVSYDIPSFIPRINSITVNVTSDGGSPITQRGIVFSVGPDVALGLSPSNTEIADLGDGVGEFTLTNIDTSDFLFETVYLKAFATNELGTEYSEAISFEPNICLAKGTKILLSNGINKNIEDITYDDNILVWNFDDGKFDSSYPLWIKKQESTKKYNLLKFSDGSELKTISQHRIFNKEAGKFTYPMTNDTPIGTTTFNNLNEEIILISKEIINEEIEYYNLITNYHINIFANGILTSCRYNNIYPIQNMKFVKEKRPTREFSDIPNKYVTGLRLYEQKYPLQEIKSYITRLQKYEVKLELI